jgi:hypothetical protein
MSIQAARGKTYNGVCTSATRPESPYVGQMIYETDTNLLRVWLGGDWSTGQTL